MIAVACNFNPLQKGINLKLYKQDSEVYRELYFMFFLCFLFLFLFHTCSQFLKGKWGRRKFELAHESTIALQFHRNFNKHLKWLT